MTGKCEYEVTSRDKISDAVRVATVMDHAPEPVKATLCHSPLDQKRSFDVMKLWMREASYVLPDLFSGQVLTQVSVVGDGGKGKEGKGKGKDKNNGDGGKGKDRDNNWTSGQQAA